MNRRAEPYPTHEPPARVLIDLMDRARLPPEQRVEYQRRMFCAVMWEVLTALELFGVDWRSRKSKGGE